jgi:beta-N-acetylhexosaminidase
MPRALVLGCSGTRIDAAERRFLADVNPLGFILFARNIESPGQVRALVAELRDSVGRDDAPVLIDQEGGRVQRLKPPHWRRHPAAARFGELAGRDARSGRTAAWLHGRRMAAEMADLGITVACAPVLDLRWPGAHDIIGDRAFGGEPDLVADLGRALRDGLMAGGVLPVVKHLPGHGRAWADSHVSLPTVDAPRDHLAATDFVPFAKHADAPWGMTAHVRYAAIDKRAAATTSQAVVRDVIRSDIGFGGVLISDDLDMKALRGRLRDRARAAIGAGCDLALQCSGKRRAMRAAAEGAPMLGDAGADRVARAEAQRREAWDGGADMAELDARLTALLDNSGYMVPHTSTSLG